MRVKDWVGVRVRMRDGNAKPRVNFHAGTLALFIMTLCGRHSLSRFSASRTMFETLRSSQCGRAMTLRVLNHS